jgi:guanylate kinase
MESGDKPRGKFILVFGPTGSGKSVLINYVKELKLNLVFPISYTTRAKRPGKENTSYEFVTVEEFNSLKEKNAFIEWAQFGDNFYSTPKDEVMKGLEEGKVLFKEIELQGLLQIREILSPEELVIIYIDAGSWDVLAQRARARAPISDDELAKRKIRYDEEVSYKSIANIIIENYDGKLEEAKEDLFNSINSVIESLRT